MLDLDEVCGDALDHGERHRAPAEAVDQHADADLAAAGGKRRRRLGPAEHIVLVDLEQQALRCDLLRGELRGDVVEESGVGERLLGDVDRQPGNARAGGERLKRVAHHPAIELRQHSIVLEHRQEVARREHRAFLLPHPDENFAQRVAPGRKAEDRLAIQRELVLLDRLSQARHGIGPPGEPGIHPVRELVVHAEILSKIDKGD